MNRAIRRLRRGLLRLAEQAARERWDRARLDREIGRLVQGFAADPQSVAADGLNAEAVEHYTRLTTRTATPQAQADAAGVLRTAGRDVTRLAGKLRSSLLDDIARALASNGRIAEVETVVRRRTKQADHAVRTVAQTAAGGFDRAQTLAQAAPVAGIRFKYAGPPADRAFCQARLDEASNGVTYTDAEIRGLRNGQGLDAALYCGGYNCRHRWVAVIPRGVPQPVPTVPAVPTEVPPAYSSADWLADLATIDTPAISASRDKAEFASGVAAGKIRIPKRTKDVGLTPDEAFPVNLYTRSGVQPHHYKAVNRRLYEAHRDGGAPGDTPPLPTGWTEAYERATNAALRRLPTRPGTVWRRLDRAELAAEDRVLFDAAHVPGAVVEYGAFTSTSTSRTVADGFRGDTLFKITSKTGRSVGSVSDLAGEGEVLFPTRTRFRVVDVHEVPAANGATARRDITLEEL